MKRKPGFAQISAYGNVQGFNFFAMELLGPSLNSLFKTNRNSFDLRTVVKIGHDLVNHLEALHNENIVHADIKPDNVTVGLNNHTELYIIDFRLSHTMSNENKLPVHIKYIVGTFEYLSLGVHKSIVSFKNDLESLVIMLVFLLKGKLP